MLKYLAIALLVLNCTSAWAVNVQSDSTDEDTQLSHPNTLSVELLGRGLLYSVDFDHAISDNWSLGAGASYFSVSDLSAAVSVLVLPLYANYYFSPYSNRGFLSAGLDVVVGSASVSGTSSGTSYFSGSGAAAVLGGGYEYRGTGGFLFRAAPYLLLSSNVQLWFGLSFGGAF